MPHRILAKSDSGFDHIEIGRCRSFTFAGGIYEDHRIGDHEILLDGWKTPVETGHAASFSPIDLNITTADDLQRYRLLIAVLVEMMGGAVTIQPSEVLRARNELLLDYQEQRDPWMCILKTVQK